MEGKKLLFNCVKINDKLLSAFCVVTQTFDALKEYFKDSPIKLL